MRKTLSANQDMIEGTASKTAHTEEGIIELKNMPS